MFPAMVVRYNMGWTEMLLIDVPLFAAATLSVFNFYLISQREAYPRLESRACSTCRWSWPSASAWPSTTPRRVLEALFGQPGEFTRTPKYGIERAQDDWQHKKYHQSMPVQPFIEVGARPLLHGRGVLRAARNGIYGTLPFLVLFQFGFLYMGLMSILQQIGGDDLLVKAPQIAGGK